MTGRSVARSRWGHHSGVAGSNAPIRRPPTTAEEAHMWSAGHPRRRRAVLAALRAVGDTGMSVPALGVALDLPEPQLVQVLDGLVRSGRVGAHEDPPFPRYVPSGTRYLLTTRRHARTRHHLVPVPPARR